MAPQWEPGTMYNYGDVVTYAGEQYKIIQPHRSQSDWTPPATPALWGHISGDECRQKSYYEGECKPSGYNPVYEQQFQQPCHQRKERDQSSYNVPVTQPPKQEAEKHWYDLDDEKKKKLGVGGGILAGAAVLGAGLLAYKEHGKKEEENQAHNWAESTWLRDAQARTEQFRSGRYPGPVAWVLNEGRSIPRDAIQGGEERGERLYICRAYHEGGLMIGKACHVFKKGAVIGYAHKEYHLNTYEILVGDARAVRWVPVTGQFDVRKLGGARPVEGGREPDGTPQYIAQAPHQKAVHPGKACEAYGDGCFIPYDNSEKKVKEYSVLCYA
ncbi:carbohydrate-binding module family 12 protein [Pisolithus thermaeus]|nr:carbohydrate-binding module family 12 protein [Pisolithus croceorrhizus]KAI6166097.1 carbohydrate-binding module family 12 protein [Pisolithus thermaeus]